MECADGFRRNPDTENCEDVNECYEQENEELCKEGRVCVNTAPGYKCACPTGQEENKDGNCVPKKGESVPK